MIYTEAGKLKLIELIIKENNNDVLHKIENMLMASSVLPSARFADFSNKLTKEELDEFEKNIKEGCESINSDDWK